MKRMLVAAVACASLSLSCFAEPLTTAVTYQGELAQDGNLANGVFDLKFRLYDFAIGGGSVGSEVTASGVSISNGRFTQSLDFGAGAFNGQRRWLEIDVRPAGGGAYTTLAPRQELTTAPYAAFATGATNLGGQPASYYLNAGNLTGTVSGSAISGTYPQAITLTNPANIFIGSGAGLSQLNASALSAGTIDESRLSSGVARRNQLNTFLAANVFSATTFLEGQVHVGVAGPGRMNVASDLFQTLHVENSTPSAGTAIFASTSSTNQCYGVRGVQRAGASFTTPVGGAGVFGESDTGFGVAGFSSTTTSIAGVLGLANATTGFGQGGAFTSNADQGVGVWARTASSTGVNYALRASATSPNGYAGYFEGTKSYFQGAVGIGTLNPSHNLHVAGTARIDGALTLNAPLQATAGISLPATIRTKALDSSLWQPYSSTLAFNRIGLAGHCVTATSAGTSMIFYMPIDLPEGAIVRGVTVYVTDNDATQNISATLVRALHTVNSSVTTVGTSRTSSGASASVRTLVWTGQAHLIDPDSESFHVSVSWTSPTTPTNILLGNVVVSYEISTPLP